MEFISQKDLLVKAVATTSRLATTRATLPILQNLYLEAKKDQLLIRSTDLEQTLEVVVKGQVSEPGKITIPARLLLDYLQNDSDQEIKLKTKDLTLEVSSANNKANLIGLAPEEYPTIPAIKAETSLGLAGSVIKTIISQTIFASSFADSQPVLNSSLWRFQDQQLTVVATDGYRLARSQTPITASVTGDYLLPRRALQELERLVGEGEVAIDFAPAQAKFTVGDTSLTTRILDGSFPAFEGIIPKTEKISTTVASQALLQSLKLASLFSRDSAYSTKLTLDKSSLTITAISPQLGENSSQLTLDQPVGQPLTISANAQYLIEALAVLPGDVKLSFIDVKSPIVLTDPKQKDYLYLVMPLRAD